MFSNVAVVFFKYVIMNEKKCAVLLGPRCQKKKTWCRHERCLQLKYIGFKAVLSVTKNKK